MSGNNTRGAGRKPSLTKIQIAEARGQHESGETVTKLAEKYGVSRQTMSAYLNRSDDAVQLEKIYRTYRAWAVLNKEFHRLDSVQDYHIRMEFMCEDEICTVILVNYKKKEISIVNKSDNVLHRAFGVKVKPTWEDFQYFLESRCFPKTRDHLKSILQDLGLDSYDPLAIIERTKGRMAEDRQWIRLSYYRPEL